MPSALGRQVLSAAEHARIEADAVLVEARNLGLLTGR